MVEAITRALCDKLKRTPTEADIAQKMSADRWPRIVLELRTVRPDVGVELLCGRRGTTLIGTTDYHAWHPFSFLVVTAPMFDSYPRSLCA